MNWDLRPMRSVILACFATGLASPAGLDTDPHLVGWWKLDDGEGKMVADSSGKGRNGTLQGEAEWVEGRAGKALQFDGKKGFVDIAGYKGISGAQPRTVAAWIRTKVSRGEILSWGLNDAGKMWTFCFIRGRVGVTPKGGYLYINKEINDGEWHHVAAVLTGGDPPNLHDDVKLYVDGQPAEIHDIGLLDLWPIDTGSDKDVAIGRGFNGCLDDVRLYDRALSRDEVSALFGKK
jgi:hypothetical protein